MVDKLRSPLPVVAAGQALTGTLTAVGGNATTHAVPLGALGVASVWVDYTRHGSSTTGRPIVAVELSRDAPDTAAASVGHWARVPMGDGSTFSAGSLEVYQESLRYNPTASGTSTWTWPSIDVTGAHWIRVLVADVDGTNTGTVGVFLTGTV